MHPKMLQAPATFYCLAPARAGTLPCPPHGPHGRCPRACARGDAALRLLRALTDRFKGHDQLRAAPPLGRAEPRNLENGRHIERA